MSTIDKLMILGVRAFNTRHGETIKFEPPLTLVAGVNGSGKTTIIECLKFATTGILPPGSKQQGAFIHDPGLEGEREVMAQVKIGFHAPNGTRLVATRSLQLSVKKASRSQKTLEALLLMERHGQKTTLSTRVSELDAQVPSYLGVSTSLLENVIFCHQEDSLWPLAESSVLKKKFDDIFEAAKYTKAVDELKKIRKKHRDDLGRQEEVQNSAKKDRDRARKVQRKCEDLQDEVETLRTQAIDLQEKTDRARNLASDAQQAAEGYAEILGRLSGYKVEASNKRESLKTLKSRLKEMNESDEWLQNALSKFAATLNENEKAIKARQTRASELGREAAGVKHDHYNLLARKGNLEGAREDQDKRLERRRELIRDTASRHQIAGYENLDDESQVADFLIKFKKVEKQKRTAFVKARADIDTQMKEAQTACNKAESRKEALIYERDVAKRDIASYERDAGELQKAIDRLDADEGGLAALQLRTDEMSSRLQDIRTAEQRSETDGKIKDAEADLRRLKRNAEQLNDTLIEGTRRAEEVAEVSLLQKNIKEQTKSLQTLTNAHGERITSLVGVWSTETLEQCLEQAKAGATKDKIEVEGQRTAVRRELDRLSDKLTSMRSEIDLSLKEAGQKESKIQAAVDGDVDEYEEAVSNAQARLDFARDTAKGLGGLSDWFSKVLETAADRHACRLCERAFKSADDPAFKRFRSKIEGLIKKSSAEESKQELEEAEADNKRLTDVALDYQRWKSLTEHDMPRLRKDADQLELERNKLVERIEVHDARVDEKVTVQKELDSISKQVSNIVRAAQAIQNSESRLDDLQRRQSHSHGVQKRLEDVNEEIRSTRKEIQVVEETVQRLNGEKQRTSREKHDLELQLSERQVELNQVKAQLEKKGDLVRQQNRAKVSSVDKGNLIRQTDEKIVSLGLECDAAQARLQDLEARKKEKVREMETTLAELFSSLTTLDQIGHEIESFENREVDKQLAGTVKEMRGLEKQLEELQEQEAEIQDEIKELQRQADNSSTIQQQYTDNLDYRKLLRDLEFVEGQVEELESKDAHIDRDKLKAEEKRRTQEQHKFSGQREGVVAEMKTKDKQLEELLTEYRTDLKDAASRYKESHIKFETTKAAIEDIGRYEKALDQAIMKYHTLKMAEVNEIMHELWQKCYQGSDIDSILIRSDMEAKSTLARSHSYRVVMLKRNVELDMRGRCSAGQKVLASIIVRLALAECFSRDCGVIALDEPTTNLDRDNIEALAVALHEIIKMRKGQKNFQLIIITHDEAFLRRMRCSEFTDYYYRVSRDTDDNSIIERQSILQVMDG